MGTLYVGYMCIKLCVLQAEQYVLLRRECTDILVHTLTCQN
jgi:hypothetical protein